MQLVDAQITGYVNNTLRFHADALATATLDSATLAYNYGVYLLYNIGYGGYANIPLYSWAMTSQNLFTTPKSITLYSNGDVLSTSSSSSTKRRDFDHLEGGILNSARSDELLEPSPVSLQEKVVSFDNGKIAQYVGNFPDVNATMQLFRRDDAGAEAVDEGQAADFTLAQSFTCPPTACAAADGSDTALQARAAGLPACPSTLPDFRSKPPK